MTSTRPTIRQTLLAATLLLTGIALTLVPATGHGGESTSIPVTISPFELTSIDRLRTTTPGTIPEGASLPTVGDSVYVPLQIEFESVAARRRFRAPEGVTVFHEFDRFADAFLDVRSRTGLTDLQAVKGVVWIDADFQSIKVPPPPKVLESKGEKARDLAQIIVRGGYESYKGKGVIVAVIDDGIDFRHKDFITYDSEGKPTSRILYYWDTFARQSNPDSPGRAAPVFYPNGASIGVVYSKDDLTAELRTPAGRIPVTGVGDHGTRCAGIAVGNGNGKPDGRYVGVAPEADLICVRIGYNGPWNQFLLGAITAWLDEIAGDKPCVVSCSFGHAQQGGRDGCRVTERQLDARFALDRKGRAICIAAGNDAVRLGMNSSDYHAEATFRGEEDKGAIAWTATSGYRVRIYVNTNDPDDVAFRVQGTPKPDVQRYVHPLSKALVIEVGVQNLGVGQGKGQIEVWSKSRKHLRADAFIDTEPRWNSGRFQGGVVSRTQLLRTPGTMVNALTIGSYDFNAMDDNASTTSPVILSGSNGEPMRLGDLSDYTSPGYSRSGQVKPIIVSPGQWYLSAAAGGASDAYARMNGTSAATPYTAGVVALLFEKKPDLTLGQLHQLLRRHATTNEVTGRTPNPRWGYGRFDYEAVKAVFKAIE